MDENPYKAPQTNCNPIRHRATKPVKFDKLGFLAHVFAATAAAVAHVSIETAVACFFATLICIGLGKRK